MTDIVERLRSSVVWYSANAETVIEAADEITRLRAALRSLVGAVADHTSQKSIPDALREARAALEAAHDR